MNFFKRIFKREQKVIITSPSNDELQQRINALHPILQLAQFPNNYATKFLYKEECCYTAFYSVAIRLLKEFHFTEDRLKYIASNLAFPQRETIQNKTQLITLLEKEMNSPVQENYTALGFRGIWVMLNDNIKKINQEYIAEIKMSLSPFLRCHHY